MEAVEGHFVNSRGQRLHTVYQKPPGPAKAVVIFHHGYGAHIKLYKYTFRAMAKAGIAVYGYDAHGHGTSDPTHGPGRLLIKDVADLVDDVYTFAQDVVLADQPSPPPPLFIAGHSMGGLVAAHTALRNQEMWKGLVLVSAVTSPVAPGDRRAWLFQMLLATAARVIPQVRLPLPQRPYESWSESAELVASLKQDPLVDFRPPKLASYRALAAGVLGLQAIQQHLSLPLLAVHAPRDPLCSFRGVRQLLAGVASRDAALEEVPGYDHCPLDGPHRERVLASLTQWLLARAVAGAPAAGARL